MACREGRLASALRENSLEAVCQAARNVVLKAETDGRLAAALHLPSEAEAKQAATQAEAKEESPREKRVHDAEARAFAAEARAAAAEKAAAEGKVAAEALVLALERAAMADKLAEENRAVVAALAKAVARAEAAEKSAEDRLTQLLAAAEARAAAAERLAEEAKVQLAASVRTVAALPPSAPPSFAAAPVTPATAPMAPSAATLACASVVIYEDDDAQLTMEVLDKGLPKWLASLPAASEVCSVAGSAATASLVEFAIDDEAPRLIHELCDLALLAAGAQDVCTAAGLAATASLVDLAIDDEAPRLIRQLCDLAWLAASAQDVCTVAGSAATASEVDQAIGDEAPRLISQLCDFALWAASAQASPPSEARSARVSARRPPQIPSAPGVFQAQQQPASRASWQAISRPNSSRQKSSRQSTSRGSEWSQEPSTGGEEEEAELVKTITNLVIATVSGQAATEAARAAPKPHVLDKAGARSDFAVPDGGTVASGAGAAAQAAVAVAVPAAVPAAVLRQALETAELRPWSSISFADSAAVEESSALVHSLLTTFSDGFSL